MKKSKIEIEIEKFWRDITKQIRKNALKEQKQAELEQKKEERKQQISKKGFFSGFQGSQRSEKIPYESTYEFQTTNFAENKPIKAIFKRISSSTTAAGAGRTGAYIGRISNEDEEQMLFYRGYDYFDDINEKTIKNMIAYNKDAKEFLNNCFQEDIESLSPTIGGGSEVESHHYIFSLPEYTRTQDNKILPKEKLNEIIKQATINTIKSNEILSKRAILMAIHEENHAHILISATNFQGKKDLRYITNAQQMDILRDFAKNCRDLGLNVQIPPKKEKPLNLKELNKITSIEYKENNEIKAITLENSQGATKRLSAVSINDFMQKNGLKINDKISIEIQKNKFGRNFYKLLEKEENTEKEEPKIIKVSEQKEELNRLLQAEQQRQEKERAEEKKQHEDKTEQEDSLETTLNTLKEIVEKLNPNQQKEQTEQEEKIKELKKDKKVAIERLKKEVQPLKQEEDYYKHTTNQTYQGYKSIKIRIYENEIQSLNRDENAGLGDIKSSFDLTMDYRKQNKNFLYELSLRRIQSFLNYRKDEIEKQEQDWEYEIEKTEEKRAKQEEIQKKKEPKPQEKPQIKEQEIKKPQEPKKEYIKPKPKKKDRGFDR